MPSQKPTERPQSHARQQGYRDTTRHANAPQRAAESAQSHARKNDRETHPEQRPPPEWVSFRSLFVLFRWELAGAKFVELIFDLLKSPFCGFSENEKVYFLSRFPRRHRAEAHQLPRNQDTAVAPLRGLLLHREGCSA